VLNFKPNEKKQVKTSRRDRPEEKKRGKACKLIFEMKGNGVVRHSLRFWSETGERKYATKVAERREKREEIYRGIEICIQGESGLKMEEEHQGTSFLRAKSLNSLCRIREEKSPSN